jgi:hypothetical protein
MPVSEKSLANLNPAKPGEVRNPVGVNRKRPWTDRYYKNPLPNLIRVKFNEKMGAEVLEPGATLADVGTLRTHMDAIMEGGTRAAREIADRIEGKAPHRLEISGPERKEIHDKSGARQAVIVQRVEFLTTYANVMVTKSGSNTWHGSLFELVRNDIFDAKSFFDSPTAPIPPFRQNQFGGSLGGPLVKSKTFFFLSYEGQRVRKSLTQTFSVPTPAMRAGDFDGL